MIKAYLPILVCVNLAYFPLGFDRCVFEASETALFKTVVVVSLLRMVVVKPIAVPVQVVTPHNHPMGALQVLYLIAVPLQRLTVQSHLILIEA